LTRAVNITINIHCTVQYIVRLLDAGTDVNPVVFALWGRAQSHWASLSHNRVRLHWLLPSETKFFLDYLVHLTKCRLVGTGTPDVGQWLSSVPSRHTRFTEVGL